MIALVAATIVAVWPPEPDADRLLLVEDGLALPDEIVTREDAELCAVWEIPVGTDRSYYAISLDVSGNESGPSNVLGAPNVAKVACLRRQLAGLSCQ